MAVPLKDNTARLGHQFGWNSEILECNSIGQTPCGACGTLLLCLSDGETCWS